MALKGIPANTEQTRCFDPMLSQCWASVEDDGPTLPQQWANVLCLLGIRNISQHCVNAGPTCICLILTQQLV